MEAPAAVRLNDPGSDTSVLIDLERGSFLEVMFSHPYEFAVPDVPYHREMQGEWGEWLVALGLRVEEVSKEGVPNALRCHSALRVLSVPDSFALALAKERVWSLLTGDIDLRHVAADETAECTACCGCWTGWKWQRYPDCRRCTMAWRLCPAIGAAAP